MVRDPTPLFGRELVHGVGVAARFQRTVAADHFLERVAQIRADLVLVLDRLSALMVLLTYLVLVVGLVVLWLLLPAGFWAQLIAFALFRFFDAVKPGPVAWADELFKGLGWRGGWGIMFDDLVAAFCTLLVIALWRHFV